MFMQEVKAYPISNVTPDFAYGNVFSHYEKTGRVLGSFRLADRGDLKSSQDNHEL